jgi:hypothetical protein
MVGGGIYGVASGGGDDDSDEVTVSTPAFPGIPSTQESTTPGFNPCRTAAERDSRLVFIDSLELQPVGKETGTAEVGATCAGPTVALSIRLEGMNAPDPSNSYFVYLFTSRRKFDQIGSLIGPKDGAFGSATITSDIDTSKYDEIVITRVPFGKGERRPRRIVFRGSL